MERLTKKTIGCFRYTLKDHEPVPGEFGTYEAFFDYSMAVKKLGEYEDAEEAKVQQPKTHGDRIRAMTDEELCDFILDKRENGHCSNDKCYHSDPDKGCEDCTLEWLKQEATNGNS